MNVLIYIEPQIEHDAPLHKRNWVQEWVPRIMDGLRAAFPYKLRVLAVAADHLVDEAPSVPGLEWIGIPQRLAVELRSENALAGRVKRFREGSDGTASAVHARRIARCLPGFVPDCVIALSDGRFLKAVYPQAAIVQHEYGQFSRAPFPESFFFDPLGGGGTAWLNRHWSSMVETWEPKPEQLSVAREFVETYRKVITETNPFDEFITDARRRFDRFAMLPIHLHGQPLYDGLSDVASPLQLVLACLEALPSNMGLLVSAHPGGRMMDETIRDYLASRYSAFLMPQGGTWHAAPSQYLVPASESVVCVSSTVSALTLFWGNAFVSAGSGYLEFLAASRWAPPWPRESGLNLMQRERLIAWLLFRFLAVDADVRDGSWMHAVLNGALDCQSKQCFGNYYSAMPDRSPEMVHKRWVVEVERQGQHMRFARDVGRYAQALNSEDDRAWCALEADLDMLAPKIGQSPERASFHFNKAMASINRKGDRLSAAALFGIAREEYAELCSHRPDDHLREMYWQSAFHVAYALRGTKERDGFRVAIAHLMCDAPEAVGTMPPALSRRLSELLAS